MSTWHPSEPQTSSEPLQNTNQLRVLLPGKNCPSVNPKSPKKKKKGVQKTRQLLRSSISASFFSPSGSGSGSSPPGSLHISGPVREVGLLSPGQELNPRIGGKNKTKKSQSWSGATRSWSCSPRGVRQQEECASLCVRVRMWKRNTVLTTGRCVRARARSDSSHQNALLLERGMRSAAHRAGATDPRVKDAPFIARGTSGESFQSKATQRRIFTIKDHEAYSAAVLRRNFQNL